MLQDILRFNTKATRDLDVLTPNITLGQYLSENRFSSEFIENYAIPMGAAIWSTKAKSMLEMPALFYIRFFSNHDLLKTTNTSGWWVIKGGSREYVKQIIKSFEERIRLNTPVNSIKRSQGKVIIRSGASDDEEIFDSVVIATHSNQALRMLSDSSPKEKEILSAIPYQRNAALLHTDTSVLPKRRVAWASWNYHLDQSTSRPVAMTYNMNILQSLDVAKTYCVTLNSNEIVNESKVIKELNYEHPLFTELGVSAQKRKQEISGVNNTYYCGAYWHNGFHEDGVVSALEVCRHFGLSL